MKRTRVKICGITSTEDAINAVKLGADAIGLVFYDKSPRFINLETAKKIALTLPPFVSKVGLFVDASNDEINTVLAQVPLDILQFHGNETPEQCNEYSMPYIKAVRMQNGIDIYSIASQYSDAIALLLDAYVEGIQGGDW